MSVYIKIKMSTLPKHCFDCRYCDRDYNQTVGHYQCGGNNSRKIQTNIFTHRPDWCPLIEKKD